MSRKRNRRNNEPPQSPPPSGGLTPTQIQLLGEELGKLAGIGPPGHPELNGPLLRYLWEEFPCRDQSGHQVAVQTACTKLLEKIFRNQLLLDIRADAEGWKWVIRAWLRKASRREMVKRMAKERRERRIAESGFLFVAEDQTCTDYLERRILTEDLERIRTGVLSSADPPDERFVARVVEGLSYAQVADESDKSVAALRKEFERTKARLGDELDDFESW